MLGSKARQSLGLDRAVKKVDGRPLNNPKSRKANEATQVVRSNALSNYFSGYKF